MSKIKLTSVDIIMLLLYSPGYTKEFREAIEGRTKLTKLLFIFEKEILKKFTEDTLEYSDDLFFFTAWNFGPMSIKAFKDIDFLKNIDFISTSYSNSSDILTYEEISEFNDYAEKELDVKPVEYSLERFEISDKGVQFIQQKNKYESLSNNQKEILSAFKARYNKAKLRDILRYVYTKYPEFTEKSKIKEKVLKGY